MDPLRGSLRGQVGAWVGGREQAARALDELQGLPVGADSDLVQELCEFAVSGPGVGALVQLAL